MISVWFPSWSPRIWYWAPATHAAGLVGVLAVVICAALCTSLWKVDEITWASPWSVNWLDTPACSLRTEIMATAMAPNTSGITAVTMIKLDEGESLVGPGSPCAGDGTLGPAAHACTTVRGTAEPSVAPPVSYVLRFANALSSGTGTVRRALRIPA